MPLLDELKSLYNEKFIKQVTKQFLILFIGIIIYSFIGSLIVESTSLMVINSGIHEFGHSAAIMLTGSNLTAIQINLDFNNYIVNTSTLIARTGINYDDNEIWILYIVKMSGSLFALIIAMLLVNTPYLRWFAPIIAMDNFAQIIPFKVSTDGYGIFNKFGAIVGTLTLIIFLAIYFIVIYKFTVYEINVKKQRDSRKEIKEIRVSALWDYPDMQ